MPYLGGSSTTAGVHYQNWFLALQLSYAFFETGFIIYPEARKTHKLIVDDILIKFGNTERHFCLKFRAPNSQHHWSQSSLKSEKVLIDFKKQHEATPENDIFLVSECNCYLLSEVFVRARNALGPIDIYEQLESKTAIKEWETLKTHLGYDDYKLINFAKKIHIKVIPVEEIKFLVKHRFMHVSKINLLEDLLFSKACEYSSWSKNIDKVDINNWFTEKDIKFKL